jgi:hypothetical protein
MSGRASKKQLWGYYRDNLMTSIVRLRYMKDEQQGIVNEAGVYWPILTGNKSQG